MSLQDRNRNNADDDIGTGPARRTGGQSQGQGNASGGAQHAAQQEQSAPPSPSGRSNDHRTPVNPPAGSRHPDRAPVPEVARRDAVEVIAPHRVIRLAAIDAAAPKAKTFARHGGVVVRHPSPTQPAGVETPSSSTPAGRDAAWRDDFGIPRTGRKQAGGQPAGQKPAGQSAGQKPGAGRGAVDAGVFARDRSVFAPPPKDTGNAGQKPDADATGAGSRVWGGSAGGGAVFADDGGNGLFSPPPSPPGGGGGGEVPTPPPIEPLAEKTGLPSWVPWAAAGAAAAVAVGALAMLAGDEPAWEPMPFAVSSPLVRPLGQAWSVRVWRLDDHSIRETWTLAQFEAHLAAGDARDPENVRPRLAELQAQNPDAGQVAQEQAQAAAQAAQLAADDAKADAQAPSNVPFVADLLDSAKGLAAKAAEAAGSPLKAVGIAAAGVGALLVGVAMVRR